MNARFEDMAMVSILIPCYNNANWVELAIQSALEQTHADKEILVFDDGSTDHSLDVIKSFGNAISWESGPNRGGNPTRNALLAAATGEFVQFLDADDALAKDKIAKHLAAFDESTDAVYGGMTLEEWNGAEVVRKVALLPDEKLDPINHWLKWQLAQTGAVLWRADSIRRIEGWNEAYMRCQDNELCLRAIQAGLEFKLSIDAGAIYRNWSTGTVSKRSPEKLYRTKLQLIEDMLNWLSQTGKLQPVYQEIAGRECFRMARSYAGHDLSQSIEYAKELKRKGLLRIEPAVAPPIYRVLFSIFGFVAAEKVAQITRSMN